MKTWPFWAEMIKDKAIFFSAVVGLVYRASSTADLSKYIPRESTANKPFPLQRPIFRVSNFQKLWAVKLLPVSAVFLIAEFLDLVTTMVGIFAIPEIWEANPIVVRLGGWPQALLLKLLAVVVIVVVIEAMNRPLRLGSVKLLSGKLPKAVWMLPVVAGLPVLWNILVIILEQIY